MNNKQPIKSELVQITDLTEAHNDFLPENYPRQTFPDPAWQWFLRACDDLEIEVDAQKRDCLEALYSHLLGVNAWLNLTRITAPDDYLKFHVFDSLTVLSLVAGMTAPGDTVVDLGAGGDYPGLPLMTWLPDRKWCLVDSRAKKVAFLREAVKLTPCANASALAFRGREVAAICPALHHSCQAMLARAVGQADELLVDAETMLALDGVLVLLKGQSWSGDEQNRFRQALGKRGFQLLQEQTIALDEQDPERWVITAMKIEDKLKKAGKKSKASKTTKANKKKRQKP